MLKTLHGFTLPLKRERKIHINITDKVYLKWPQPTACLHLVLSVPAASFHVFANTTHSLDCSFPIFCLANSCSMSGLRLEVTSPDLWSKLFVFIHPANKLKSFPLVNSRAFITNCNYLLAYAFKVYFSFLPSSQLCMSSIEVRAKSTLFTTVQGSRA